MFLKALTLKGFKSFADPATLEFEPGMTVVVGPNGSGKSNIVDAVAWVLGAQGPSALRSAKMEDVIFMGSPKRHSLGRAEVLLTLDNSDGRVPIDMSEITISRTLFRSGESEYAINGRPCRLLDIQELLADTGVGRRQHLIVSQGQLDSILNAHPEDRRAVIEEAASVVKYRRRRERAVRRLDEVSENLSRLTELAKEVKRRMRPLERQASAARAYNEASSRLQLLRIMAAKEELDRLSSRHQQISLRLEELEESSSKLLEQLEDLKKRFELLNEELVARREDDPSQMLSKVRTLEERARSLIFVLKERQRSLDSKERWERTASEMAQLQAERDALAVEVESSRRSLAEARNQEEELNAAEKQASSKVAALDSALAETSKANDASRSEELLLAEVRNAKMAVEVRAEAVERERRRLDALDKRMDELINRIDLARSEWSSIEEQLARTEEELSHWRASYEEAVAEQHRAAERVDELEHEQSSLQMRVQALSEALQAVREASGAYSISWDEGERGEGILGVLGDLVKVDQGWELAFAAAIGSTLASVVAGDFQSAIAVVAQLRQAEQAGTVVLADSARFAVKSNESAARDSTSPVDNLSLGPYDTLGNPSDDSEPYERLDRHVRSDHPLLDALLGFLLSKVVVVKQDWQAAAHLAGEHPELVVVTLEGDRFALDGWRPRRKFHLATASMVEELKNRTESVSLQLSAAKTAYDRAVGEVDELHQKLAELTQLVEDGRSRLKDLDRVLSSDSAQLEAVREDRAEAAAARDELVASWEKERSKVAALEAELPEALERAAKTRAELNDLRSVRARAVSERNQLRTSLDELSRRIAVVTERSSFLEARIAQIDQRLEELNAQRGTLTGGLTAEQLSSILGLLLEKTEEYLTTLNALSASLHERKEHHLKALATLEEHLSAITRSREELEHALEEIEQEKRQIELEDTEVRVRGEAALRTLRLRLAEADESNKGTTSSIPDTITDIIDPVSAGFGSVEEVEIPEGVSLEGYIAQLEEEIARIGPVNHLAVQELEETRARADLMEAQMEDVRSSKAELTSVIRAVDEEMSSVLSTALEEIGAQFSHLIDVLFSGGTGRLVLTDPDNLLETGIDIEVHPRGKTVRRISLLSGGERSLVALAFLFAVFSARPSPFYIVDEVEAALDDVNLQRFLNLLEEFRSNAQLIVVSHQKRTMEMADVLYGVTMEPSGSSKVVSERVRQR
ncbi:MAG: chromosome segregation protein SMC [Actinobacteria bacterium]|nr:chromosome segregation protein SMC [Actinomycetota bacterium]